MSPFLESRGGIVIAIASGVPPWIAFIVCAIASIISIFIIFFVLDKLNARLMKYSFYRRKVDSYIEKYRHKFSETFTTRERFLYLMTLTAIPLPFTGAYTASLLAWLFNISRKRAYSAISFGVIISSLLVTLATVGVIKLF